jgi:hypothetical protein
MAIILEEEKKPTNWASIVGTITIVFLVFIGAYYLFFKKPELIDEVIPPSLSNLNVISQIHQIDPQAIVNSSNFKILRDYTTPLVTPATGRGNPFRP